MRILHLGKYYPPVKGGMETVLSHMCEGLLRRGHEVVALVAGVEPFDRDEIVPAEGAPGGLRLLRAGALAVVNSQPLVPSLPALLRRQLALFRPDILHLHLPHPGACLATLAALASAPSPRLAVWYHADITRQRLGRHLLAPLVRRTLARADGVGVSSRALRDSSPVLAPWRDKVRIIPFGIDPEPWQGMAPDPDGPFLFVGRLVYYKGLQVLIDAVERVPEARLVIVGDGPLRGEIADRIRSSGLGARIAMHGEIDGPALREAMGGARALVLPSSRRSETFGLVQLEAMAAGLPVVSTGLPTGVAEVNVDGETGLVVPPGDVPALAGALRRLLDDPDQGRRWGRAGRRRLEAEFSSRLMVGRLEDWYHELVADDPAPSW